MTLFVEVAEHEHMTLGADLKYFPGLILWEALVHLKVKGGSPPTPDRLCGHLLTKDGIWASTCQHSVQHSRADANFGSVNATAHIACVPFSVLLQAVGST
jgi:hypothetical protein